MAYTLAVSPSPWQQPKIWHAGIFRETVQRFAVHPMSEQAERMIIATRNRPVHAYLGIDNDIIQGDIPPLLAALKNIKQG